MSTYEQLRVERDTLEDSLRGCTVSEYQKGYVAALSYAIELLERNGER